MFPWKVFRSLDKKILQVKVLQTTVICIEGQLYNLVEVCWYLLFDISHLIFDISYFEFQSICKDFRYKQELDYSTESWARRIEHYLNKSREEKMESRNWSHI